MLMYETLAPLISIPGLHSWCRICLEFPTLGDQEGGPETCPLSLPDPVELPCKLKQDADMTTNKVGS